MQDPEGAEAECMHRKEGRLHEPTTYFLFKLQSVQRQFECCIWTPKTCESESRCIGSCRMLLNWPRCSQRDRVTMLRLDDCHCHPGREPIAQEFRFWSMPTQHCNPRAEIMCCDNTQALLENDRKKCFGLGRLRHADSSEVQAVRRVQLTRPVRFITCPYEYGSDRFNCLATG